MHDLIIIGAGPAGLTASIYALRYKIKHLLLGAETGGYLGEIHKIENYPGFKSITGFELAQKMKEQVEYLGGKVTNEEILEIEKKEDDLFLIKTSTNEYETRNIIYCAGTKARQLGVPGEKEFIGKGVSYCATCDAAFFKEKEVIVVGGSNAAASAALVLSEHAKKVTVIYRGEKLRCEPKFVEAFEKKGIEIIYNTNLVEIKGEQLVKSVVFDQPHNDSVEFKTDGVFVEIGSEPNIGPLEKIGVKINDQKYIITSPDQSTNVPGIYAAGDITTNSSGFRQIITAAAEGAVATLAVYEKLKK